MFKVKMTIISKHFLSNQAQTIPKILGNVFHFKHFAGAHGGSTVQFRSVKSGLDPTAQRPWISVPFSAAKRAVTPNSPASHSDSLFPNRKQFRETNNND